MSNPYNYDYCCMELETVGREIRNKIMESLPVIFHDVRMMRLLSWLFPKDEQRCPFCHVPIEKTLKRMELQWYDKHPEANVSIEFKKNQLIEDLSGLD